MDLIQKFINYANLGYDVSLTSIVGFDGIRMVKRYSHVAEKALISEQVVSYDELKSEESLEKILRFLYEDIQNQEKTKEYRSSTAEWLSL